MNWIDQARRTAFNSYIRAKRQGAPVDSNRPLGDLERVLPEEMKKQAVRIENELILPYEDVLTAIGIAKEHRIAVLGFDSGEVLEDGFQVMDYSGYDANVPVTSDWKAYVTAMNGLAEQWIKDHRLGRNHGYILSATSEREFSLLDIRKA